jgi:hypothetical protein
MIVAAIAHGRCDPEAVANEASRNAARRRAGISGKSSEFAGSSADSRNEVPLALK